MSDLFAALAKAQAAMVNVAFDKVNPHFKSKYASLAAVIDAVRQPLADNGLSVTQTLHINEDHTRYLKTTLRHASSPEVIESCHALPNGVRAQEFGSALTYARRYSLSALLNIAADDDDDGNVAHNSKHKPPQPAPNVIQPQSPHDPETGELIEALQQSVERVNAELIERVFKFADQGTEAFSEFFRSLNQEQRDIIHPFGQELRNRINAADDKEQQNRVS
jgi:hypothetical protein